jgi:putative ABC transport system permease protein
MLLGWLQLKHKPLRLAVALSGIAFAVLLIMMQLGFRSALFESAVRFHERFDYDIALFSPDSVFIVRPQRGSTR